MTALPWMSPAALLAMLLFGSSSPALACSCPNPYRIELLSPSIGAQGLPINSVVKFIDYNATNGPQPLRFEVDGSEWPSVEERRPIGNNVLIYLRPLDALPENAEITVLFEGIDSPVLEFSTGSFRDDEAPAFNRIGVESTRKKFGSCGKFWAHQFLVEGLTEDYWPDDEVMVVGEPLDDRHAAFVLPASAAHLIASMCGDMDSTLRTDFHRKYRIRLEDGSGNLSPEIEINTATAGCGCTAGGSGPFTWATLIFLVAAFRRRLSS